MSPPPPATVHKALRVALATSIAVLISRYAIGNAVMAPFAGLSAIALSGLADYGGPLPRRVRAYLVTLVLGVVIVVVGTEVSRVTWASALVVFVVGFVVSMGAVFGGYAIAGSMAVILLMIVSSGIPGTAAQIPDRLAGLVLGGALSTIAAVVVFPDRLRQDYRHRVAAALRSVAACADSIAGADEPTGRDAVRRSATVSVRDARADLAAAVERPVGPFTEDLALAALNYGTQRVGMVLPALAPSPPTDHGEQALLHALAGALADSAAAVDTGATPPDVARLTTAVTDYDADRHRRLAALVAAGRVEQFEPESRRAYLLRYQATATTAIADAATTLVIGAHAGSAVGGPLSQVASGAIGPLVAWRHRLLTNLRPDSVLFQNGLRLGIALAGAVLVTRLADLQHGFWVVFATLSTMRTTVRAIGNSLLEAVGGTAIGAALAGALILTVGPHADWYALVMPVVIFVGFIAAGYGLLGTQASFTVVIAVLFAQLTPVGWDIGLIRLQDVVAGALVGVLIGVIAWPRGAATVLRRDVADLITSGGTFAAETARHQLGVVQRPDERAVREAARRVQDTFAQYLTEHPRSHRRTEWVDDLVGWGHRLWYSSDALTAVAAHVLRPGLCPVFVAALAEHARRLGPRYDATADALRHRTAPPPTGAPPSLGREGLGCLANFRGSTDPAALTDVVDVFTIRAWLVSLEDELVQVHDLVARLDRSPPVPSAVPVSRSDRDVHGHV
ncbi:MAG TPA: FUSC family protein [Mycobacteriales bacterium]